MKKINHFLLALCLLSACTNGEDIEPAFYDCNLNFTDLSQTNPNNLKYQLVLDEMTSKGVVGVEMSVYNNTNGIWLGASGKADLHNNIDMKSCNISRFGSTVKMLTATII